jgi:flagellar biosynthesis/type III secretory pathway protein FliH
MFAHRSRHDVIAQLREVTHSPSPLSRFLQDPAILELSKSKQKGHRRSSRSRERRTPSITTLALVEEERQVNHLKVLLGSASDRLEYEIRRADEAEARAQYAEMRAKDATTQLVAAETAKRGAEAGSQQLSADNKRYQIQFEHLEREMKRLKADILRLEEENEWLEASNIKAKESSRHYQNALRDYQAREDGREEGQQRAMQQCFEDGREEGWSLGQDEGFEEGRQEGFQEGLRTGRKQGFGEGREHGRNEERKNAMEAFDRFMNEEMHEYDDEVSLITKSLSIPIPHNHISAKRKDSQMGRVSVLSKFRLSIDIFSRNISLRSSQVSMRRLGLAGW